MRLQMSIMVNIFLTSYSIYSVLVVIQFHLSILYLILLFIRSEILSDEALSVSSPRFSPDGKYLVWLQHPSGGPHQSAFALVKCDWETKNVNTHLLLIG